MLEFIVNTFIAIGLIIVGSRKLIKYLHRKQFSSVTGKVVAFKKELEAEYFVKYPIVNYSINNENISTQADFGMSLFNWKIGDEITVYYDANDPSKCFLWDYRIKNLSVFIIIIGIIFFIVGFQFL